MSSGISEITRINLNTDIFNELEKPVIYIAKKDKEILDVISIYEKMSLEFNLNAFNIVSFEVYEEIDGDIQRYYENIEEGRLLLIQGLGWYEIHVSESNNGGSWVKTVTGNSLECMLCQRYLVDFECNTGEILYDDYVKTIFYDPTNPKGSLLHRVLDIAPNWSIGHVDDSLCKKQRSFDVDNQDVYSFLTGEVSEACECLFVFDTYNMTVNAYDLESYGNDTGIYISEENLAESINITVEENSIITCLRVYGGDGIYVNEVNPNGTNKIYNFSYYMNEMPTSLANKLRSYNEMYDLHRDLYEDIMQRMNACTEAILELKNRVPESLASTNWSEYGLTLLEAKQKAFKTQDEIYKSLDMDKEGSSSYESYLENSTNLLHVNAEISTRESEISVQEYIYESIKKERDHVQFNLDMNEWFTKEEWKQLSFYVKEDVYKNDNFIVTDQEDDSERLNITKQLLEKATKDLDKYCRPQYQYSTTLNNILMIPEFKESNKQFTLGNFIYMQPNYGGVVKMRLISFKIDFDNLENIDVTFSDTVRLNDAYDDMSSIIAQASSLASSFKFNKSQYDKANKSSNWIEDVRKYGLDVATTAIRDSNGIAPTIDDTGLTLRKWNYEHNDYDPEQIKMIQNMIVFSDDNFNSTKLAIGKIPLGNGEFGWGINSEFLITPLIMSEHLWLENESGTYKFEDSGFTASNGINTIKISPNKNDELFSIYKKNDKLLYFDSNGNAHFKGILDASEGRFSGLISGGSININDNFIVNNNGDVTAKSGTFSGDIVGASIDIGDGSFKVDRETGFITEDIGIHGGFWIGNNSIVGLGQYSFVHKLTKLDSGIYELKIYEKGWESLDPLDTVLYEKKPSDYEIFKIKEKYLSLYNRRNSFQAYSDKNECALSIAYSPSSEEAIKSGSEKSVGWKTGLFVVFQNGKMKCQSIQVVNKSYGTSSGTTESLVYPISDDLTNSNKINWTPSVGWVKGYVKSNVNSSNIIASVGQASNGKGTYVNIGSSTVATTGWCHNTFAQLSVISSLQSRVSALESKIK